MAINVEFTETIHTPQEKTFFLKRGDCLRLTPTDSARVNRYISGTFLETRSVTESVTFGAYFSDMSFRIYCQSGDATIEIGADTGGEAATAIHPYYHFHGFAGTQAADDDKFYDLSGVNHATRGANLSVSQLWATAGYASTVDSASGAVDSVLRIPSLNFDYAAGEKLIIWWLGKASPEATNYTLIGDGESSSLRGIEVRVKTNGKMDIVLFGATSGYSSDTTGTPFDGNLHSIGVAWNGEDRTHAMWVDDEVSYGGGVGYGSFGSTSYDTKTSNTLNIGMAHAAPGATWEAGAVRTRALVVIRLPASYTMPTASAVTSVFQQLRSNPGKLVLASAL